MATHPDKKPSSRLSTIRDTAKSVGQKTAKWLLAIDYKISSDMSGASRKPLSDEEVAEFGIAQSSGSVDKVELVNRLKYRAARNGYPPKMRNKIVAIVATAVLGAIGIVAGHTEVNSEAPPPPTPTATAPELSPQMSCVTTDILEQKAEFDQMSDAELAQWILDCTADTATDEMPVCTPTDSDAYQDLKNTAEGKPAYEQLLTTLDGKEIKMDIEINRDILIFRALLTAALQQPENYYKGSPILIQSGQLTNRSGSHAGRSAESHYFGSSIDFSGVLKKGKDNKQYAYDHPANRKLGEIADEIGKLVGIKTSSKTASLERVDSLHGTPKLSKSHYHFNVTGKKAWKHTQKAGESILDVDKLANDSDVDFELIRAELDQLEKELGVPESSRGNIERIYNFLTTESFKYLDNKPMNGAQAIGFISNFALESYLNPAQRQHNGPAFGLAQWEDREKNLRQFAKDNNLDVNDLYTQLNFMKYELNGTEKNTVRNDIFKEIRNPLSAAVWVCQKYERPGKPNNQKRMVYAYKIAKIIEKAKS